MRTITFAQAVREAMSEEMRRDESVFLMGEDVGVFGGSFDISGDMIEEFGEARVMDTPISESGFMGAATGSAMTGMRPIVELMYSDFSAVAFDQIINQAAKMRYMYGGMFKTPMVIRTASGGGTGAASQHSQSLEALFCHIPGLKVVMPSTPLDAKGLLKAAIRDDNCVIFLEPKFLYGTLGGVPEDEYIIELGKADLKREGTDVSVITYGRAVQTALNAAEAFSKRGISVEVLDLRTLLPLDTEAILKTAAKTRRVVILHEATEFGGLGGEISATIAETEIIKDLKSPVKRVGGLFSPVPFARALESAVLPDEARLEAVISSLF